MRRIIGSIIYRIVRYTMLRVLRVRAAFNKECFDLEAIITIGDRYLSLIDKYLGAVVFQFKSPAKKTVKLHHLTFSSPLIASSFKGDIPIIKLWLKMGLGGAIFKTILLEPRSGNSKPRIQEIKLNGETGLINALGLPGPGIHKLVSEINQSELILKGKPLGISIGGHNSKEYLSIFEILESHFKNKENLFYELNISCPNVDKGQDLLNNPTLLQSIVKTMRQRTDRVIGVKCSPDQTNESLIQLVKALYDLPGLYINCGNTSYRTCDQVNLKNGDLSRGGGGLSGPFLFERTLEMVRLLAPYGIPIMATGGISKGRQIRELQKEGAILFGMATQLIQDPYQIPKLNQSLSN